jgi:hypothetical protein
MFEKTYEQRLALWHNFRDSLESSETPIQDTLKFYSTAPRVSIHTDPYDNSIWPNPWELIKENQYCDFCLLLGVCYTLQLTERFKGSIFEIHIAQDHTNAETLYLLYIDELVIGWNEHYAHRDEIPNSVVAQNIYAMPALQ